MTETVSSDGKTVAEKSYMLTDSTINITVNGKKTEKVALLGGATATITVTITLSEGDKAYLNDNFENGMYVEGFISLVQTLSDSDQYNDLSLPFLAFYGDWTDAPMLDYSSFEVAENEADDSIPDDEKIEIQFYSTTPFSKYEEDYIIPMGQYLYKMSDDMETIYASEDKAALSMYNELNHYTTYEFYAVYAGLLRGMAVCDVKIVNEYTGEIVWQDTLTNVAKGYASGGSTRPGYIKVEMNPSELNLPGNTKYHFYMEGYLDYGDGTQGHNNSFDFTFYTDYEEPTLVDAQLRYEEYLDSNEDTQTRIYLDLTTYDNHYTQAILLCYVDDENYLRLLTQYVTPVYSDGRGQTVKTSIEITDYYEQYFDNMSVQIEDYAMNYKVVTLDLSSAITFPESISFDEDSLSLTVGQSATPSLTTTPTTAQHYDLIWQSSDESVVKVEKGEIYAVGVGSARVTVYASNETTFQVASAVIDVVVTEGDTTTMYKSLSLDLIKNSDNVPVNPTNTTVSVHPNEYIQLTTYSEPWYLPQMQVTWSSHNNLVATVDENGLVHTLKEGKAVITAQQVDGLFSVFVTLDVGPEFVISSYVLTGYYGVGGDVVVPDELNFMYIDEECFMNNTTITSFIVPKDVVQIYEKAFYGCTSLKYIKFPKTLTLVEESAFEGCTALETVDLSDALSIIFSNRCFYGCSSLKEIVNDERLTAVWDYTFAGCSSLEELNISNLVQVGKYSFANCTSLKTITSSKYTVVGEGMFFGCIALNDLVLSAEYVGKNAFYACSGLQTLALTGECQLAEGAFRDCTSLSRLYFVGDVYEIGEKAFAGCSALRVLVMPNNYVSLAGDAFNRCTSLNVLGLGENTYLSSADAFRNCGSVTAIVSAQVVESDDGYDFNIESDATSLKNYAVYDGVLYNKEQTQIVLVPVGMTEVTLPDSLTAIGNGAFYGLTNLKAVTIPQSVTQIGEYAFSYSGISSIYIPSSVTTIGTGAFAYCYSLKSVTFDNNSKITAIPEGCFNTTYALTSLALPATVKEIGAYAFGASGISSLYPIGGTKVEGALSDKFAFESIGENAFASTCLKKVVLPSTLKSLGSYAFAVCPDLEEVTFNSNVQMGDFVFFDSTHLTYVQFYGDMESIGNYTLPQPSATTRLKR
jgi:uncharacterized protein YjdB